MEKLHSTEACTQCTKNSNLVMAGITLESCVKDNLIFKALISDVFWQRREFGKWTKTTAESQRLHGQ